MKLRLAEKLYDNVSLVKRVGFPDPENVDGVTIELYYNNESGKYGFTILEESHYLHSEYETIEDAEYAGRMEYYYMFNEEDEDVEFWEKTEHKLRSPCIEFIVEMVGFPQSIISEGIKWQTKSWFFNKKLVGDKVIEALRVKFNEMGYGLKNKGSQQYIITPSVEKIGNPYQIETVSNEVLKVINDITNIERAEMN